MKEMIDREVILIVIQCIENNLTDSGLKEKEKLIQKKFREFLNNQVYFQEIRLIQKKIVKYSNKSFHFI